MARGWESKSVEAQIDMAETRKREGLALSRTRVVRELETVQNPRYKVVLSKALADLDAQLKALD